MKKRFLAAAAVLLCFLSAAGCARQQTAAQPAETEIAAAPQHSAPAEPASAPEPAVQASTPTPVAAPEAAQGEEMLGLWYDAYSGRAHMTIARAGDGFSVVIGWADSAFEDNQWRMRGVYEDVEDGRIVSQDCALYHITYNDDGSFEEERVYDGGGAHITYVNGMLYWYDAVEDAGADCMFERAEAPETELANPMTPVADSLALYEATGLTLAAPWSAEPAAYHIIDGGVAQVRFTLDGVAYVARCCVTGAYEDISGVYVSFANTKEMLWGDYPYTIWYNEGGGAGLATWFDRYSSASYSVYMESGASEEALAWVAEAIIPAE